MAVKGRSSKVRPVYEVRELTREDMTYLQGERAVKPYAVQKLRDPHHNLARHIAAGMPLIEAAARTGYSYTRAVMLANDPAFQQLVAEKRAVVDKVMAEETGAYAELALGNMIKAERMIAEHLDMADETQELPPIKTLLAISRDAADRFGYGKNQTNVNVNVDFAAALERAINRSKAKVIDVKPEVSQPMRRLA